MYRRNCQHQRNSLQPFLFKEKQKYKSKMNIFNWETQLIYWPAVFFTGNQSNVFALKKLDTANLLAYHLLFYETELNTNPEAEVFKMHNFNQRCLPAQLGRLI